MQAPSYIEGAPYSSETMFEAPNSFLNTVTGVKFVDDRLTAMEYGDNV